MSAIDRDVPLEDALNARPLGIRAKEALHTAGRRAKPYVPALIASGVVGAICVQGIIARAGHPAAPLDDAFIHLHYARRLVEGGFFSYAAGDSYSTGATSVLWPLILAPFYAIGIRGLSLLWAAWALGTLAHAALAVEAARITDRLAGREAAIGAGAMCSAFGAFAWFASSGMETIPFAWILLRTARVASQAEPDDAAELIALGVAAPLLRPEGFLASFVAAAGIFIARRRSPIRSRALCLAPLAGPLIVPALHLALAGHVTSSTATVKWLLLNPYYSGWTLAHAVLEHARILVTSLLYGEDWTAMFLPEGSNVPILLGLPAVFIAGARRGKKLEAAFVAVIALGALIPCTYASFLWNRIRYEWPFAAAWFVMVACLAREIGDLARRASPSLTFVTPLGCGIFAGALVGHLPWAVRDLVESASAVDGQQVALARWASENLPSSARIGVNDAGAIAYLSGRRTFDLVGLTMEGEARYWVAGAGSRFEHYERMNRDALPTHFIVYPQWMACPPVLGDELWKATVEDQSVLGGSTMIAYEARWDTLGSGASPVSAPKGAELLDELDVADLESEAAHAYALDGAMEEENQAALMPRPRSDVERPEGGADPDASPALNALMADGGRTNRARDRFHLQLRGARRSTLILRAASMTASDTSLSIVVDGRVVGAIEIPPGAWVERSIELPASEADRSALIEVVAKTGERFSSFHYWLYGF